MTHLPLKERNGERHGELHYPYHELVDAEFPLKNAAEAMDKSDRKEITRAALVP